MEDWTYSFDGAAKMVVKLEGGANNVSTALIPFCYVDRVGQFILSKIKRAEFIEDKEEEIKG